MRTEHREVSIERDLQFPPQRTRERLRTAPQHPVMHKQQRAPHPRRHCEHRLARIHRRAYTHHAPAVFDLKPILRTGVVRDASVAEQFIEMAGDVAEHGCERE